MNSGEGRRQPRPRTRVAVHPSSPSLPRLRPRLALRGRKSVPPFLRGLFEHFLVAGPIFGMLSAIYGYHLSQIGWPDPDAATQHVVRQTEVWHGHFIRAYFITPSENLLWWGLSAPGLIWLIAMILGMVVLGVRSHHAKH